MNAKKMLLLHFTFQKQLVAFCCANESRIPIQLPAPLFVSHEALLDFLSLSRGAAIPPLLTQPSQGARVEKCVLILSNGAPDVHAPYVFILVTIQKWLPIEGSV